MRRWPAVLPMALAALGLAACADSPSPAGPTAAAAVLGACDTKIVKGLITKEFSSPDQLTASNLLKVIQTSGGGSAAATGAGFDIMALIAGNVRNGTATGTPQVGSDLTNGLIACMNVGVSDAIDFTPALSAGGTYEVRAGANDATGAAVARGLAGSATWGVEAPNGSWGSTRFLLYGRPGTFAFTPEKPAGSAYQFATVPASLAFTPRLVVGTCIGAGTGVRVQHSSTVLPLVTPAFCGGLAMGPAADRGTFAWARRLLRAVTPAPLYASASGPGGLATNFSPFAAVQSDTVRLAFQAPIADAKAAAVIQSTSGAVTVLATAKQGTPIEGLSITVSVITNSGSFTLGGTLTATTDASGVATFAPTLDKPGGYTFVATADPNASFIAPSRTSTLFHINF